MTELEDRLRSALEARAVTYEASPQAWIGVRRRTLRLRRRRIWQVALVPIVAAAVALPIFLTMGGVQNDDVMTGDATPEPDGDLYTRLMRDKTPLGERLILDNPSQNRTMILWFARPAGSAGVTGAAFCWATQARTGAGMGSCDSLVDSRPQDERAWMERSTESWPPPQKVLYYGAARDGVAGVSAVVKNGSKVPGTLRRPEGAPLGIWTVTASSKAQVTTFEFTDANGRVLERVKRDPSYNVGPQGVGKPVGPAMDMPGGLTAKVYRNPDQTLIWTLDDQEVGTHLVRPHDLMTDMGGRKYSVELRDQAGHWFGVTTAQTARVELIFNDGQRATADTQADRWKIGIRLFSGTYDRAGDIYLEGFQLVGYNAAGTEIWRQDTPPQKPQWPHPTPTR
jgi:hypothetical protein